MKQNITLNFTGAQTLGKVAEEQPLAVMPADLAKQLLIHYADNLYTVSPSVIINEFRNSIYDDETVNDVINKCLAFIQQRTLIREVAQQNWEYFSVEKPIEPLG